ncbi:MAG: response regulator transcription factor [Acidimicrobiia bacterium]
MSTILVVDDHQDIRMLFEVELSFGDHRVLQAADGEEALEVLAGESVDLMILDIMMPRLSGEEVLRRLGPDFETPIVVVTAKEAQTFAEYLELGAVDAIEKPFDLGQALDLVEGLLRVEPSERQEHRRRRIAELRGRA